MRFMASTPEICTDMVTTLVYNSKAVNDMIKASGGILAYLWLKRYSDAWLIQDISIFEEQTLTTVSMFSRLYR